MLKLCGDKMDEIKLQKLKIRLKRNVKAFEKHIANNHFGRAYELHMRISNILILIDSVKSFTSYTM